MSMPKTSVFIKDGIIHVRGFVDGKRYQRSTRKKDTKSNLLWVKKNASSVLLQLVVKSEPNEDSAEMPTLEEYGYRSLALNRTRRVENTTLEYTRDFKNQILPYFGKWKLDQIKSRDLKEWQARLLQTKSAVRVINIRNVFQVILQDAFLDELIDRNPFDRVKKPSKKRPKIFPFTLTEVQMLIEQSEGWFRNYLIIAFFTGMRTGELLALKWENVNFDEKRIQIRKSMRKGKLTDCKTDNSLRDIDMLPIVEQAFIAQKRLTGQYQNVFLTQYNTPYTRSDKITSFQWKPLLRKCGLDYRILYKTRHSFASIMLQRGEEIGWVSNMLGHANINITLTKYAQYMPRDNVKRAGFLNDLFN